MFLHSNDRSLSRLAILAAVSLVCAVAGAQAILPTAKPKAAAPSSSNKAHKPDAKESAGLLERRANAMRGYIQNKGQWPSDVFFAGRSAGMDLWVTKEGLRLDTYVMSDAGLKGHVVGIKFVGAKPLQAKGSDASRMLTDFIGYKHEARSAKTFGTVESSNLYPGVTLKNYFDGARPRYDLVLAPNANPSQIKMSYQASSGIILSKNKLSIKTSVGDIVENKLMAYQVVNGAKKPVEVAFHSVNKNTVGFTVGSYDRSKALVIDPLIYGTYYGGDSGMDEIHAVVADLVGGVYMTGSTRSLDFPIIFGPYEDFTLNKGNNPYDNIHKLNNRDGFVSKLAGDAYVHDYAAFLGGSREDSGEYLQLDQFGDLWVAGYTASTDFADQHLPNVIYLSYDPNNSQGHQKSGGVYGPPVENGPSGPNGNGQFRISLSSVGGASDPIPWNAPPSVVQATFQSFLDSVFGSGATSVQVSDPSGLNNICTDFDNGKLGYKMVLSPGIVGDLVIDNSKLGAFYSVTREGGSNPSRAQLITVDKSIGEPLATRGDYTLTVPGFGTTIPIPFNAPTPVVQAAINAVVGGGAQVKAANQAGTGALPVTSYIVLFTTPVSNITVNSVGVNEVQEVDVSGSTGGTFTLTPNGAGTTIPIAFNASAATVQTDLQAVIGATVSVTSPTPQVYDITFIGALGLRPVTLIGNFTAMVGGTNTVKEITAGAGGIDNAYIVVPLTLDNMFWDKANSAAPKGPDPNWNLGLAPPNPNPNGGAFNIEYNNVFGVVPGAWNANAKQLHDAVASVATVGDTIVVMPNSANQPSLPGGSLAVIFSDDKWVFQGNAIPAPVAIANNQVIVGSDTGPIVGATAMLAAGRISPTPVYTAHAEPKVFLMRFKQDANTVLNPGSPSTSYFFGGNEPPTLTGFRIIPHDNPVAGEAIRFAFSGNCFESNQLLPEIQGQPRDVNNFAGFMLRVNYTPGSGFAVVNAASKYVDAFDSATQTSYGVTVNGMDVDANANIYIGGTLRGPFGTTIDTAQQTTIFPTTAVDPAGTLNNGRLMRNWDGFARKYSSTGALTYSVLVGGTGADEGAGIAVDPNGDAYLLGVSRSFDYPRTHGVFGETFSSDTVSTIAKLNPSATNLIYCTSLNTGGVVYPQGIAVDARGTAFATFIISRVTVFHEWTPGNDPNMADSFLFNGSIPIGTGSDPALSGAYNTGAEGGGDYGSTDGGLMVLNPSGTTLLYSTYLGSKLDDFVYPPYVDSGGDCWVFGWTDTLRDYHREKKFADGLVRIQSVTRLPDSMITSLAFRPNPDPNMDSQGPGDQLAPWQLYNNQANFEPVFLNSIRNRDGWVGRFRIGLSSVASVSFTPTTVPGGLGQAASGTVTLSLPAPPGGAVVSLSMGANSAASFDPNSSVTSSSVVIPAGLRSNTVPFLVYTEPVTDNTPVDVTATYQGNFHVGRIVVTPWLQSLTLNPPAVVGGNSVSALIQLAALTGSGGINVTLTSDTPSVVPLTGVTGFVPPAQTSSSVQIPTNGVDQDTTVTLNASLLGVGKAFQLVVHPAQLKSLTFGPNPVSSGSSTTGTLTLNGKAGPNGFTVNLSVQGAPAGYTITPSTLTFKGGQTSQTFTVKTPYESQTTPRVIVATMQPAGGYTPNTITGTLNVTADSVTLLTVTPSSVAGGTAATGQVTLGTPALAGGAPVDITVSPSNGVVLVPAQVIVPVGQTSVTFSIPTTTTVSGGTFTITATRGTSSGQATLTVTPLTFTISVPGILAPSSSSTGTIQLSGPAPAGGISVHLTSSIPSVLSVPSTVLIAAGNSSSSFPITTFGIASNTAVTVSATIGTTTHSANTTIQASKLTAITLNPSYALNLTTTKCSLALSGPAPAGGMVIHLTNSNPALASVPATVTIPAGATTYSFSIITLRVTRTLQTTIQGSGPNGGAAAATLTVHN